jgi:hypothetical protein
MVLFPCGVYPIHFQNKSSPYLISCFWIYTTCIIQKGDIMRTSYPTPTFSDGYQYKLVDSTFIHAVHIARTVGNGNYCLGISFQKDENTICWYVVKDPVAVYKKLTDPNQSPGFTFNNSVKGKKFNALHVYDKAGYSTEYKEPQKYNVNTKEATKKLLEAWKAELNKPVAPKLVKPKADLTPLPKDPGYVGQSGYGTLLEVYQECGKSSCISYLALGYNRKDKNFVVYFTLKSQGAQNMQAFFTDDASVYRDWTNAESLGKYYNRNIRYVEDTFSVRAAAKA